MGHEGAGEFADDVVALDGATGQILPVTTTGPKPCPRGWGYAAAIDSSSMIMMGGLTGSDANPTRLDDVWKLTVRRRVISGAGWLKLGVGVALVAGIAIGVAKTRRARAT
eukprot:g40322.t1